MIFLTLIKFSIKEALARKILLTLFLIVSVIVVIFLAVLNMDASEGIFLAMQVGEGFDYRNAVITFENGMISQFPFFVIMLLLLTMVSSFIPSMLEKGNVEILLSKPVSRQNIILAKFAAGIVIVFFFLSYLIFLIWLIISFKTGVWHFPFLYSIIWYTYIFAILYSGVILTGVLTGSTILTLILNILIFFPVTSLLSVRQGVYQVLNNKIIESIIDFFYYLLPKPWDIRSICSSVIDGSLSVEGGIFYSFQPVITSTVFMLAALSISIYYFGKKDY